jgi:hypothetical protein
MKFEKINRRAVLVTVEILAVIFVFLALGASSLAWRLLSGPMEISFAKPYVLAALRNEKTGVYTSMDRIVLQWPETHGPILLGMENIRFYDVDGKAIASVGEAALGLSKKYLMLGQIVPVTLILKNQALRIIRYEDNGFDIILDQELDSRAPPMVGLDSGENPLEKMIGWLASPGMDPDEPAFLRGFRLFEIEGARVIVDDRLLDISWTFPRLDVWMERRSDGLYSKGLVRFDERTSQPAALKVDAILDAETRKIDVDAMLEHFELSFLASRIPELLVFKDHRELLDARLNFRIGADLTLESAKFTLLSGTGDINLPALSEKLMPASNIEMLAEYDGKSGDLLLKRAHVTLNGTLDMRADAAFKVWKDGFEGQANFMVDRLRQADIGSIWPAASQKWIVENLSVGVFSDVHAIVNLQGKKIENRWQIELGNVTSGFQFENMTVNYRAPLAPVTKAKGKGSFDLGSETLRIAVESAKLLDMQIAKADVRMVNIIEAGKGKVDIEATLSGPLKSVLDYVKNEPININTDFDRKDLQGQVDLQANIFFPARSDLKMEDVKVNVKGEMRDFVLPGVLKNMTLTGETLEFGVMGNLFKVSGSGKLESRDIEFDYQEFLNSKGQEYSRKVKASFVVDHDLRTRKDMDLSMFLDGPIPVNVTFTQYEGGESIANLEIDLKQTRLFFDLFDYEKKLGDVGSVTLRAVLHNGNLKEIRDLKGRAGNLLVESSTLAFRQKGMETEISSGEISRLTLNETVVGVKFDVAENGQLDVILDGPFLDFLPFMNNKKESESPHANLPLRLSIAVDRMRTAENETIQSPRILADIDRHGVFNHLEVDAIAGKGNLHLRYKPDESGRHVFSLDAEDAGAALRAFAVYDNIIGGKMVIYGESIRGMYDRDLQGVAEISDFKVVNAPILARLVGALSLTGVLQHLDNDGLAFSKLEAKFDWIFQPGGNLLVLNEGKTSGNELGLTFDGTFDKATDTVDISGTIIPFASINMAIGNIPLVGDLITGGTGSLIAATYSLKGPAKKPVTSVNPLSVLSPGILRRILFE